MKKPLVLLAALAAVAATAQAEQKHFSPHVDRDYPMQLLWGDAHVHSSYSMDANSMGNTQLGPDDAYRFAKGEQVTSNSGQPVKLSQPLDFLVVSDHAEYMGVLPKLRESDAKLLENPVAKQLYDTLNKGGTEAAQEVMGVLIGSLSANKPAFDNADFKRSIWQEITGLADEHNEPGVFSAMIGFEWTSMPSGDNLHRVVVYRDGADKAAQMVPVSAFDGERPEDLWAFMDQYESQTGGNILAIPHNGNVSNGRMFEVQQYDGSPIDEAYATERARWEPIVEVTQIKGDGETHPLLSPDDEFADFETWDESNIRVGNTIPKSTDMLPFEYARSALKLGLQVDDKVGVNPFQFGMIGSTDAHTSLATGAENDFWGKAVFVEPGVKSPNHDFPRTSEVFLTANQGAEYDIMAWRQVASGYAAVWATENSREAIFDAMQRREVYATSGPRISVRFFGGFDFAEADLQSPDYVAAGYAKGVPMGGELTSADLNGDAAKAAPGFMVTALKDVEGANLDRIQIVKGWTDAEGNAQEKVYNVAASDGRKISRKGKLKPLKSSVEGTSFRNDTGAATLQTFWRDPDFDPEQRAFYYARVLEIAKPRWTAYDEERLKAPLLEGTQVEIQDRAYTSPIWYSPK